MTLFQANALKAICPATVHIMLRVLRTGGASDHTSAAGTEAGLGLGFGDGGGGGVVGAAIRDDTLQLKYLVLKCLVRAVHCIHTCRPEEVGNRTPPPCHPPYPPTTQFIQNHHC